MYYIYFEQIKKAYYNLDTFISTIDYLDKNKIEYQI